jgi:3-hydroxyacyl-CoA dehydrogenase/enoyl-CoA hydratase/3-hydroxybutyryl-CoA epimerase
MLYESQNFRIEADDQVVTLWLDFRGRPNHSLTLPTLNELALVLDRIASLPTPDVILIRSSRPDTFLEEFDAAELARFTSPLEFAAFARRGQDVARKLEHLPAPTVAVVEGRCAGAGLELALACTYRVAIDGPRTCLESGEVARGLVPSWGGTYRLTRAVGVAAALRILLSGDVLNPWAAKCESLVHRVVSATRAAVEVPALVDRLRDNRRLGGPSVVRRLVRTLRALVRSPAYPSLPPKADGLLSPAAALRQAVVAGLSSEGEGLAAERAMLARLGVTDRTRNLLAVHRQAATPIRVFPEPVNPIPPAPRRVGIVGGGDLGTALAARLARFGLDVTIQERDTDAAERAGRRVAERLARSGDATARNVPTVQRTAEWVGFDEADLVIEAADEDAGIKRNLLHELERRVRPRVIVATAATTVTVESIQSELARPGRVAGLHLPNLDGRRPVAELVGTPLTDSGTLVALGRWVRDWGLTPVRVADRPGRLVEFVRLTYLSEAVNLVAEGLPIDWIDAGLRRFGMSFGPLEWCDEIGLDRLAERTAQMQLARGDGFARSLLFQRLVPYGCVGKAVGEGFYRYGWRQRPSQVARMALWQDLDEDATASYLFDPQEAIHDGIERVVLRSVNAAAAALAEEPDADPAAVDLALVFGMGWSAERGGPLRHADAIGLPVIVERLAHFAERFGPRLLPCDELVRRAEAGESFYGGASVDPVAVTHLPWRMAG